jgi:hypothetical protein
MANRVDPGNGAIGTNRRRWSAGFPARSNSRTLDRFLESNYSRQSDIAAAWKTRAPAVVMASGYTRANLPVGNFDYVE